ncbi:hypothetical protein J4Q44_G00057390 [Coregonus suidteri]|uniref:Uncharacterized protein n=1 Tax=Coregonus suidteri TaxID=861788 RepID=A0AAN8M2A7_9TELE
MRDMERFLSIEKSAPAHVKGLLLPIASNTIHKARHVEWGLDVAIKLLHYDDSPVMYCWMTASTPWQVPVFWVTGSELTDFGLARVYHSFSKATMKNTGKEGASSEQCNRVSDFFMTKMDTIRTNITASKTACT